MTYMDAASSACSRAQRRARRAASRGCSARTIRQAGDPCAGRPIGAAGPAAAGCAVPNGASPIAIVDGGTARRRRRHERARAQACGRLPGGAAPPPSAASAAGRSCRRCGSSSSSQPAIRSPDLFGFGDAAVTSHWFSAVTEEYGVAAPLASACTSSARKLPTGTRSTTRGGQVRRADAGVGDESAEPRRKTLYLVYLPPGVELANNATCNGPGSAGYHHQIRNRRRRIRGGATLYQSGFEIG